MNSAEPQSAAVRSAHLFPFGLVALGHRRVARIVVSFAAARGGTDLAFYGNAALGMRNAFAELADGPA